MRLVDNTDSAFYNYYREIVGSDTIDNGKIICYGTDDSLLYLYLRDGNNLVLLNKTPRYITAWSVGTLQEVTDNAIITRIDNGNSSPPSYQVFDKNSGINLLGQDKTALDYWHNGDTITAFYDRFDEDDVKYKVCLLDLKTRRLEEYAIADSIPDDLHVILKDMTRKKLTLGFERIPTHEELDSLTIMRK